MTKFTIFILLISCLMYVSCSEQRPSQSPLKNMQNDIKILASDSLEGREAGTEGEIMARDYIASQLEMNHIKPLFPNSYFRKFSFKDGNDYSKSSLTIGDTEFKVNEDYIPSSKSINGNVNGDLLMVGYGIMGNGHNDYTNHSILDQKIFVMELSVPDGFKHWDEYAEQAPIDKKIDLAQKFGAQAIIFINTDSTFDDPRKQLPDMPRTPIPIIFAKKTLQDYLLQHSNENITLKVDIQKRDKEGYNIGGVISGQQPKKCIVIGAHYDHLGHGGPTSREPGSHEIHNGADDNASGVAMVLEIARQFQETTPNYTIIPLLFSGEEKGLLGSTALLKSNILDSFQVLCMLNFDMVGRLDASNPELTLFGTGTATEWDSIINLLDSNNMNIKRAPSGIGGSDQLNFYLDSIPVLFFFTGFHNDYHKSSDDYERINFDGMMQIQNLSKSLIWKLDSIPNLHFKTTKARAKAGSHNYRKGPTLGIVPDYGSSTEGMAIKAVMPDKAGEKAGLQANDVLIELHEKEIKDIYDYMDALKLCKKGQSYTMKVRRNNQVIPLKVKF